MRLWLEFINSEFPESLASFDSFVQWLEDITILDHERGVTLRRRALLQPAGATAALLEARRVRAALRALIDRGPRTDESRTRSLAELNRVLGRSAGMRRIELLDDGRFVRSFVATGDAFAGLVIPLAESATDSLVRGELGRVHECANPHCRRVFFDESRNSSRKWCAMGACGNRAKARRYRQARKPELEP